jgi:hypothetical protein
MRIATRRNRGEVMTEKEWLTCADPRALIWFLRKDASNRRMRLLACAFCRHIWTWLPAEPWYRLVEVAERYADCAADDRERLAARREIATQPYDTATVMGSVFHQYAARLVVRSLNKKVELWCDNGIGSVELPCWYASEHLDDWTRMQKWPELKEPENRWHACVIRDIFGNPFRSVSVDPAWLTSDAMALAQGIYDERAFDRMPILADALQDAGCTNDDVLNHCRDANRVHVRGCWVVDLLLGKT